MKKISILLLVLASLLCAEVKVETAVRIENLPEELFLDEHNLGEDPEECLSFYKGKARNDYNSVACGFAGLCQSMLDTSVLLGWSGGMNYFFDEGSVEFYVFSDATHSWKEVFEYEFKQYRRCYFLTDNDSIFNSFFEIIDSVLVPEVEKSLKGNYNKPLIFDYSRGEMREIAVPGPNFEFGKFADDSVDARNAAISSIRQKQYRLAPVRVQGHRLIVPAKLIVRPFVLFDVNGHELRRGTLKNNMEVPAYPTVIKIQGYSAKLLK